MRGKRKDDEGARWRRRKEEGSLPLTSLATTTGSTQVRVRENHVSWWNFREGRIVSWADWSLSLRRSWGVGMEKR